GPRKNCGSRCSAARRSSPAARSTSSGTTGRSTAATRSEISPIRSRRSPTASAGRSPRSIMDAESARQWVHIGSGLFALALRALTWWQAAALAGFALLFNALALPRIGGRRLYRPVDEARGFPLGILLYPIAVLLLILIFPARLDIAAVAWAILAFGDGSATLVGRAVSTRARAAAAGRAHSRP